MLGDIFTNGSIPMKSLTRDIIVTLCFKLVLLVMLWWVSIKGVEKNMIDLPQWLYGVHQGQEVKGVK